jgi:hypothetical protein
VHCASIDRTGSIHPIRFYLTSNIRISSLALPANAVR